MEEGVTNQLNQCGAGKPTPPPLPEPRLNHFFDLCSEQVKRAPKRLENFLGLYLIWMISLTILKSKKKKRKKRRRGPVHRRHCLTAIILQ